MTVALDRAVEALTVRPGDTLIVRVDPDTSMDHVRKIKAELEEWMPENLPGVKTVVIAAAQLAAYRPDAGMSGE